MSDVTNRFQFLVVPENQDWARGVLAQDSKLRRGERTRLDVALGFPDLFEQGPYDHILYKTLRRSENVFARELAADLRRNIGRFDRFETFWQAREARPIRLHAVQMPVPFFQQPLVRPIPAAVGISVLLGALTIAQ